MSNQQKSRIESRQQSNKKVKNKNIFSSNTLCSIGSINKEKTEKKLFKDLSLNFLKYYSTASLNNKTCVNHSHKKIIIKDKLRLNNTKNITLKNNNKFIKFPLKLNNGKQSISLKNLIEEENILNMPIRLSDKRKNTNTKIELFSTNSTLSFLNLKDNNKDICKPIKIKCFNKDKTKKKFSSTFFEKKINLKTKLNSKIKIKHIKSHKKIKINLQKNKKPGIKDNIFNNSNKSIEFGLSYIKPINKRRNLSIGQNDNSNSNTNSTNELYNKTIKKKYLNCSNLLFDNMSFSLNNYKNINESGYKNGNGYMFTNNKVDLNNFYKINKINNENKKNNLSSLPNLLCNNYMNMHNYTVSANDLFNINYKNNKNLKYYNNKSSYQNIFEQKKENPNYIKIKKIDYKSCNYKFNTNKNFNKIYKLNEKEEKNCNNEYNINKQLKNIHSGIKSLLDGLYNIYLNANRNENSIG